MKRLPGSPGRASGLAAGGSLFGSLNLIHTNNSPNPATARVPARLPTFPADPEGVPLQHVFRVISGELSPLEFIALRRAVNDPR